MMPAMFWGKLVGRDSLPLDSLMSLSQSLHLGWVCEILWIIVRL